MMGYTAWKEKQAEELRRKALENGTASGWLFKLSNTKRESFYPVDRIS